MKRWIRLIHGLRIRARLQAQYADRGPATGEPAEVASAESALAPRHEADEVSVDFFSLLCLLDSGPDSFWKSVN